MLKSKTEKRFENKIHSIIIKYDRARSDQKLGQSIRLTRYMKEILFRYRKILVKKLWNYNKNLLKDHNFLLHRKIWTMHFKSKY